MSAMSNLKHRPLSADTFAPFGNVLAFDQTQARPVNNGNALRADLPTRLSFSAGQPKLALFRVVAQTLPIAVGVLEQHPNSSQMFFPVSAKRFLVVVAPRAPDGGPDTGKAEAFVGGRGQGIAYHAGVWHAPIAALDTDVDFLMLIWEQDTPSDCRIELLAVPLQICPDRS
jgi:ureidoglycolate lyase